MTLYGVLDRRTRGIVEFFPSLAAAEQFIAECLAHEPDWTDFLAVEVVEFETSAN
jgi:hypothetical protein